MRLFWELIKGTGLLFLGLVIWLGWQLGMLMNLLALGLMATLPLLLLQRSVYIYRASHVTPFWKGTPFHSSRTMKLVVLVKSLFWLCCLAVLNVAILPVQLGDEFNSTRFLLLALSLGLVAIECVPLPKVAWSRFGARIAVFLFLIWNLVGVYFPSTDTPFFSLAFPLEGDWVVVQGGGSLLINHHVSLPQQRHALDLSRVEEGLIQRPNVESLEGVFSFGSEVYAPVDGTVVMVVDAMPDNEGFNLETENPAGNNIIIQAAPERFVIMAHLQRGSTEVNIGEQVVVGQLLARVGNSGNTSMAHMHLQVQSEADFQSESSYTFPMKFRNGEITRGGAPLGEDGQLRRNDRVFVAKGAK
jgi:hypothetical protein